MEEDEKKELGMMPWSRGQRLICALRNYNGKIGFDLRLHFFDPQSEDWRPTHKGIWVPIQKVQDFHECLGGAIERLKSLSVETKPPGTNRPENEKPDQESGATFSSSKKDLNSEHSAEDGPDEDSEVRINKWLHDQK